MQVNNQTEKKFRDTQDKFGSTNPKKMEEWVKGTYFSGDLKGKRYRTVADTFLNTDKVLDVFEISAGLGDFVTLCSKMYPQHHYFANELSEIMLRDNIGKIATMFNVSSSPKMLFGPIEELSYPPNSFDLIFIRAAVHHFEQPKKALDNIHKLLRPGGKLVFFEDPICLNIPIYRSWKKKHFCPEERALGVNEHIYTIKDYFSFGKMFQKRSNFIDVDLTREYDDQMLRRTGVKRVLGKVIRRYKFLFKKFMILRFTSPLIFVFQK